MPFRSKRQQRLFFATMPETAKEWAAKTDFSKLPEKVRKKNKDKNDCCENILQTATKYKDNVDGFVLPDGSGFAVGSYPLSKDHWLFSDVEDILPIKYENQEKKQQEAARYAIRAATNNGKIVDFDPDVLVQNFIVAMR